MARAGLVNRRFSPALGVKASLEGVVSLGFPQPIGHYSPALRAGDFLFLSGQIPVDPKTNEVKLFDGDVTKQAELVLQNIGAILQSQELGKNSVVKATIFLTDLAKFASVNEVY